MKNILLETVTQRRKSEYGETELVLPALSVIALNPKGINTSVLIERLEKMLSPTGHDAKVLKGRRDTYFSQKVRNLKSHNKLKQLGVATYSPEGMWRLTEKAFRKRERDRSDRVVATRVQRQTTWASGQDRLYRADY